ncbi:NAD(P)-binding protein [Penicillium taxi]|uniref:NAD(P)-binding protein n=1 Tax=Penicillium taxi TaxID=168475 RepID=UPI002545515E|nr:NAD(P)-binding protein [Penicillium taxi]KAJ5907391.1 NAD(P)-binding protein [Penicillium taxi]
MSAPEDILAASYKYGAPYVSSVHRSEKLKTFLFGYPIAHSMAPLLHATLFKGLSVPWTYSLKETQDSTEFLPALKQPDIVGCAVTMPYKVSLLPAVDEVTEEGRMVGAINTVFLRRAADGSTRYIGTNTDTIGVRESFLQNCPGVLAQSAGKPALVIGGGGACRAAIYALWKWMGASKIYMVNRLESEVRAIMASFKEAGLDAELIWVGSTEQAAALEAPTLIVGTVPDIPPKKEGEILAQKIVEIFLSSKTKGHILEMCYHPRPRTQLFETSEKMGWNVLYGTEAMIWQGVAQQVLWAELPIENFKLEEAKATILAALEQSTKH